MPPATRKARPPRVIRLVKRLAPFDDPPASAPLAVGVFEIRTGDDSQYYVFREIPCEIGGRGFAVHRLGLGELYHVRVDTTLADSTCECLGFLRHGRCKHVQGLLALVGHGII